MVAATMHPEPSIALGSPRTQAAMRVLGILPRDLQPRDRAKFPDGLPGEVRHELHDKQRRRYVENVSAMASDKSLDLSRSLPAGSFQTSEGTNTFLADVMAREAKSLAKIRERAKADVQKIVIKEFEIKEQIAEGKKKEQDPKDAELCPRRAKAGETLMEEHEERRKELLKERDALLAAQKKEAQKKLDKSIETRARADRIRDQEAEELINHIYEKDEKIEAALKEREAGWETTRVNKEAERQKQGEKIVKLGRQAMRAREKTYGQIVEKTTAAEDRLEKLMAEYAALQATKSDKTDGVIRRARDHAVATQVAKDSAYVERLDAHNKAEQLRRDRDKEVQTAREKANRQAKSKHEKNYERVLRDTDPSAIKPSARLTKCMSASFTTYPAWMTEGSIKHFETHKTMGELRQNNLKLLQRAHKHSQEQALNKIDDIRVRVKALSDSKSEAQFRRTEMVKNCAIEKSHLTYQVEKIRDAPLERMNGLLEHMGLPPVRSGGKEEGEEENAGKT